MKIPCHQNAKAQNVSKKDLVNLGVLVTWWLVINSCVCFAQDTSAAVFHITKMIPTAGGLNAGTIDRNTLLKAGGVAILTCPECKITGFEMKGKNMGDKSVMKSKSQWFTDEMRAYILNGSYDNEGGGTLTYYIEIFHIKVVSPGRDEQTLPDKICLYLK